MRFKVLSKASLILSSVFIFGCGFATKNVQAFDLTQQMNSYIESTFQDDPYVIGVGVVYLDTGELMVAHPFKPEKVKGKQQLLAAVLTNISRAVFNNLKKVHMHPTFTNVRCKEGLFLIKPISENLVVVGFFTPNANVQMEKLNINKLAENLKNLLNY